MNKKTVIMYRIFLRHPFTMIVAGPTGCGKTDWIKRLIARSKIAIEPQISRIIYFYGEWQKAFDEMKNVDFHAGIDRATIDSLPT